MYVSEAVSNSDSAAVVFVSTFQAGLTGGGTMAVTLGLRVGSETRAGGELDSSISVSLPTKKKHAINNSY